MSNVNHSCFSLLCITVPSCRNRTLQGRKEQNKKTEVSSSLQGVEWLFTEIQPSCFWLLMHSVVQKQPQLRQRAIVEPIAGGMLRDRERTEKKGRETTSQSKYIEEERHGRRLKIKKRGRGHEG